MAEIKIYPTYETFYKKITQGKEQDFILTTRGPIGVPYTIGDTPIPKRSFFERLFPYKEKRPLVCIGQCSNARPLFAVNPTKLKELGGKLE